MYRYSLLVLFCFIAHLVYAEPFQPISPADRHWRCGTPELTRNNLPIPMAPQLPHIPAAPAPEVHVGQINRFFTHIPEQLVKGTCLAIGDHIYVYIENSVGHMISGAEAREIAAEFDSRIYPQVHHWIGREWKPGLDRDARVTLLMHDVGANASGRDFGGYFSPIDQNPTSFNSNRQEIIFMDVFTFRQRSRFSFFSSLAHEFAHLVNWFQNGGTSDERWLEEGMASFAEWRVYGLIHNIYVDGDLGYLKDPSVSLTSAHTASVYYGASFMLLLYLFENYGGREFIRELVRQDVLGTKGIDATLAALGRSDRFADVFQNWALANFVNDINRGALLGYKNLPNRRVNTKIQQVSSYPTIRLDNLEDWGARYITFRNLPRQLEIALDGRGEGALHAQVARIPNVGAPSIHAIRFDEKDNGRIKLNNLKPTDRVILMVTTTAAQSYRYAATTDGKSGIVVGAPRPIVSAMVAPTTITHAIGNRAQPSPKQSGISYKLEPMRQVHLSSNYQDVVVVKNRAYVASDWGLEIFDLRTPTQPVRIGEIATPGNAQGLAVDADLAAIADGAEGVHLIDIRQPGAPQLIKTVGNFKYAHRIQIANNHVYVVDVKTGLSIFDLKEMRDSPNPQPISTFQTGGDAFDLWVDGDTVYLSDNGQGFQILDFARIDIPAIAGKVEIIGFDFHVEGGYAYVASGNLQIVDVRDRLNPAVIATVRTPGFTTGVKFRDGYVYLTDVQSGLHIIDARNRSRPQIVALQPTSEGATGLDVFMPEAGTTFAYIAGGSNGLHVIDVSQPKQPLWLHRLDASGAAYGLDIVQEQGGRVAYIADGRGGLKILKIDNPFDGTLTHHIPIDAIANDVGVENGYAYIAAGEDGLIVMDVRDANRPKMISQIPTSEPASSVEIDSGYAYLCAGELIVLDIRDANRIRVLARRQMPGSAYRVALAEGRAYVAALDGGVQVFDVAAPANPRAIGSYETKGNATHITMAGKRAYVLDSLVGVQIVDMTDAGRPVRVAEYETGVLPIAAQIRGDHLYLLDAESVQIVDTRNFELVSRFDELRFPAELAVIGEAVYVADVYDLRIFKINEDLFDLSVGYPTVYDGDDQNRPMVHSYTNQLGQNFPNPFNPETWMPFEIAAGASVTIQIYDIHGSLVRKLDLGYRRAGRYATRDLAGRWDGRNAFGEIVSSGIYFYDLQAGEFGVVRKMLLTR